MHVIAAHTVIVLLDAHHGIHGRRLQHLLQNRHFDIPEGTIFWGLKVTNSYLRLRDIGCISITKR